MNISFFSFLLEQCLGKKSPIRDYLYIHREYGHSSIYGQTTDLVMSLKQRELVPVSSGCIKEEENMQVSFCQISK